MPLTFDTYSNCSFNCVYCFSQYQRGIGESAAAYLAKKVKIVNVDKIKKMFTDPDKHAGQYAEYIKARYAMQWGGLSDQLDGFEYKHGATLELMEFFREINYPISFSTKATWWTEDDRYMKLLPGSNWHFKVSIITMRKDAAHAIEMGVPSTADRLDALERISDTGVETTLRLRPFIIGVSDPGHTELIAEAARRGVDSLSTEFFCCEARATPAVLLNYRVISKYCGFDVLKFYKENSHGSGYLRLNYNLKQKYVDEMKAACDRGGMRFHISDAHHKERGANGCCCGAGDSFPYFKGQMTNAIVEAAQGAGEMSYTDIGPACTAVFGSSLVRDAVNLGSTKANVAKGGWTIIDYIKAAWNNPKSAKSPYQYFGGVPKPARVDDQKNVVYRLDK
jgi:DNA repair photolyase